MRVKKILTGLEYSQYQHPYDNKAFIELEEVLSIDLVNRIITDCDVDKYYTIQCKGSNLKVSQDNFSRVYELLKYSCSILDIPKIPELFIESGDGLYSYSIGLKNPIIILKSDLINMCDDDELMFIIGRECSKIKSNNMLYHMIADIGMFYAEINNINNIITESHKNCLYRWSKISDFTADRAGLLCCQNINSAITFFLKLAGLRTNESCMMHCKSFLQQVNEFENLDYESISKIFQFFYNTKDSHSWVIMRLSELQRWYNDREFSFLDKFDSSLILSDSDKVLIENHKPRVVVKNVSSDKPILKIKDFKRANNDIGFMNEKVLVDPCVIILREIDHDNEIRLDDVLLDKIKAVDIINSIKDNSTSNAENNEYYIEDKLGRRIMSSDVRSLSDLGYISGDIIRVGKILIDN